MNKNDVGIRSDLISPLPPSTIPPLSQFMPCWQNLSFAAYRTSSTGHALIAQHPINAACWLHSRTQPRCCRTEVRVLDREYASDVAAMFCFLVD